MFRWTLWSLKLFMENFLRSKEYRQIVFQRIIEPPSRSVTMNMQKKEIETQQLKDFKAKKLNFLIDWFQLQMNYLQNVNSKFAFCMQLCSCRRRSEMGGNLAEEKELLLLAWREVGGGAGGRNGGSVGCLWRRKKEEEAEDKNLQRGEGRPHGGCPYHRWVFGFVRRLRRLLLVEEKPVVALVGGWNGGERGKEKMQKRGQRGWFLADFGPDFLLPRAMKCSPIYRR